MIFKKSLFSIALESPNCLMDLGDYRLGAKFRPVRSPWRLLNQGEWSALLGKNIKTQIIILILNRISQVGGSLRSWPNGALRLGRCPGLKHSHASSRTVSFWITLFASIFKVDSDTRFFKAEYLIGLVWEIFSGMIYEVDWFCNLRYNLISLRNMMIKRSMKAKELRFTLSFPPMSRDFTWRKKLDEVLVLAVQNLRRVFNNPL